MDAIWAVVVARVGNSAKSRLAGVLGAHDRRRLARAMLTDVLDACVKSTPPLAGTLAVVDEPVARWLAEERGIHAIEDAHPGDMNAAVAAGLDAARKLGARTAIVLPGDVPLISSRDLEVLIDAAGTAGRAVVVGASRDGQGTNALLLRPTDVIRPAFGPPSADRHLRLGQASAALTRVCSDLGLSLDLDTPADLAALADTPVGVHTAAALADLGTMRPTWISYTLGRTG
jgi:2-phospho-L-lactate/phosphoenolpyruvate guanylyltransferase